MATIKKNKNNKNNKNNKKDKRSDKTLESLVRIHLLSNIFIKTFDFMDENNLGSIEIGIKGIRERLDKVSTDVNLEEHDLIKDLCNSKDHIVNLVNGFEDLIYVFSQFYKYKKTIPYATLESKTISDKRVSMILSNNTKYAKENLQTQDIVSFIAFLTSLDTTNSYLSEFCILIIHYCTYILTCLIKIKNNSIIGLKNIKEIKFNNEAVITPGDKVEEMDLIDKIIFTHKNKRFVDFYRSFGSLIADMQGLIIQERSNNSYKELNGMIESTERKSISISNLPGDSLPFVSVKKFETVTRPNNVESMNIDLETSVPIINIIDKKKYAIGKNGAIIEFINKDKNVDSVEVVESDLYYYFNIKYINYKGCLTTVMFPDRIPYRGGDFNLVIGYKKSIILKMIETIKDDKQDETVVEILEGITTFNYDILDSEYLVDKEVISLSERQNSLNFKIRQGFFILSCLYILHCDIKNSQVKIYDRKIERKGSRIYSAKGGSYRVAYIRRLPYGAIASDDALTSAKRMGITLPDGYTFVNEHIPNTDKKQRIIKIRD